MTRFKIERPHIEAQFKVRYKKYSGRSGEIIDHVIAILEKNTPADWRFTESASSRFFIMEEETEAKFLGITYRNSEAGREIIRDVQENINDVPNLLNRLDLYVKKYIADIQDSNLPIVHHIRTVYGKGKRAHIAEEKRLFEQTRSVVSHILPLIAHKIASRPNAIVTQDGTLWVRQYLNWMGMEQGSKEYYMFQPLTKKGIEKGRFAIFSHSENGQLKKLDEKKFDCVESLGDLSDIKAEINKKGSIRSESYWKVPTCLDCRLIDLDFLERYSEKGVKILSSELIELYFLKKIVNKAMPRFYKR